MGDMLAFGAFFFAFMIARAQSPETFDASRKTLHVGIGLTNTFVLLVSSLCVVIALGAIRTGTPRTAITATAAAIGCGVTFITFKATEYSLAIDAGHVPSLNPFYTYYFVLTGVHLLHVFLGIGALIFLLAQAHRREMSPARIALVEGAACFWHLVDMLWIVIFPLLYLVS